MDEDASLRADCGRCAGLCCVALAFDRSALFAEHKPAGAACRYLNAADRCAIHANRAEHGFAGCAGYDCLGAGQLVTQELSAASPGAIAAMVDKRCLPPSRRPGGFRDGSSFS